MKLFFFFSSLFFVTNTSHGTVPEAPKSLLRDISCLELTIHHEAKNQSFAGKQAVANVVLNRTNNKKFPSDVCSVITQKYQGRCEFSFVCVPNWNRVRPTNDIRQIAFDAVVNRKLKDNTNGALFFHHKDLPQWENLRKTKTIGDHIFYAYMKGK